MIPIPDWPSRLPRLVVSPPAGTEERTREDPLATTTEETASTEGTGPGREAFVLSGDRAFVRGHPPTGVDEIRIHPFLLARELRVELPAPHRVEVATGAARRHISLGGVSVVESVLVFHRLPGVVLQWKRVGCTGVDDAPSDGPGKSIEPDRSSTELVLGWTLAPNARAELPEGPSGPLRLLPDPTDPASTVRVDSLGTGGSWKVKEADAELGAASGDVPLQVTLRASLETGVPLTLLFSLDPGDGRQRRVVSRRATSLDTEIAAWAAADARATETELTLSSNDSETDEAFRWARRGLHGAVAHTADGDLVVVGTGGNGASAVELARIGHGLLALGRHEEAGEVVGRAVDLLLADPDVGEGPDEGRHPSPVTRHGAALLLLTARFVLWSGNPRPLQRLGDGPEVWISRPGGADALDPRTFAALFEWAEALEATGDRRKAEVIRNRLGEGEGGGKGSGTESGDGRVAHLLFDLLGARADAFFGRLRLAPALPEAWTRVIVGGIRMGDSRVRLSYHAGAGRHTFRLEPMGGRVPVNLVFEPLLPVGSPGAAWVDGAPAELDRYRSGTRGGARLQLPLDAPREVVLHEADDEKNEGGG